MADINIPTEAVDAVARIQYQRFRTLYDDGTFPDWDQLNHSVRECYCEDATAIIRAALAAWPGSRNWQHCAPCNEGPHILLPLNTENPDAEA